MIIKSCAHCGGKAVKIVYGLDIIAVGWECEVCRASVYTYCHKDMVEYNLRKMGIQWNMRAEVNEENSIEFEN